MRLLFERSKSSRAEPVRSRSGAGGTGGTGITIIAIARGEENTFAKNAGKDPLALETQLDFVWHELTTHAGYGLATLKRATTISAAVKVFQDKYEVCGRCAAGGRVTFAQSALTAFGNLSTTDVPATETSEEEAPGDCIVDGVAGDCISTGKCRSNGGVSTPKLCAGANDIQCCTPAP